MELCKKKNTQIYVVLLWRVEGVSDTSHWIVEYNKKNSFEIQFVKKRNSKRLFLFFRDCYSFVVSSILVANKQVFKV